MPAYEDLLSENERLKIEISNLKRLIFGQKRERYIPVNPINQLLFPGFDQKEDVQIETEQISYTRKKSVKKVVPHGRNRIPAHFPRKEIIIEPEEDTSGMTRIGEEITEELEYKPGTFYVNRYIRPKYARPDGEGVVIGMLPSRPIEKGIAGPGLLAHVMISKFVDHLPIYRQRKQFLRQGIDLAESTINGWIKSSYELLIPLYDAQRAQVLQTDYLMADETPIRVLDFLKPGTTHRGYYWVYYDPVRRMLFFDYRMGRSRAGPNDILKDFKGYLQSDGYKGYNEVNSQPFVTGVGCMAHARRYFVEAKKADSERSEWMLLNIQKLYKVERWAREGGLSYDQRYSLRQKDSVPILAEIKNWLDGEIVKTLPKSAIGKAIAYMLNQWSRLEQYVTDGRLEIDNNLVENAIRPIALGRKNYLFAGSHEGAKRAALIYTMVANAKLQSLEPFAYLRDVIARIADHPIKKIDDLLAFNWKITDSSS